MNSKASISADVLKNLCSDITYSRKASLSQILFERLKHAILSEELPEGYVFPNENEMCNIMDVGRSTLREAYTQLQLSGLINRTKNGTVVNDAGTIRAKTTLSEIVDQSDMKNIIEFREVIEIAMVSACAGKATAKDLKKLHALLEKQHHAGDDIELLTDLDYTFHKTLADIAANPLLLSSLESVQPKFKKAAHLVFERQNRHNINEHRAIVDAIEARDAEAAIAAMRAHLHSIQKVALAHES